MNSIPMFKNLRSFKRKGKFCLREIVGVMDIINLSKTEIQYTLK